MRNSTPPARSLEVPDFEGENTELTQKLASQLPARRESLTRDEAAELNRYKAHSLADLEKAELMERTDTKFVLPRRRLANLLRSMRSHYTTLEISDNRVFSYLNTYYDNVDYTHYADHHNGKLNRYKVRTRIYVDSRSSYLEVKFKNNKQRTLKSRVQLHSAQWELNESDCRFLSDAGIKDSENLHAVQVGSYSRIALANETRGERLTIDSNLTFLNLDENRSVSLEPWVIVELKQTRLDRTSPFYFWARKNGLRKSSFSKYCMGVYFCGPKAIKRNKFHPVARRLELSRVGIKTHRGLQRHTVVANNRLRPQPCFSGQACPEQGQR